MKVWELAKKLNRTNKDLLGELGLKSHMSKVPDSVVAEHLGEEKKITPEPEAVETVDTAETLVVEFEDSGWTLEDAKTSIRALGGKSPCWKWRDKIG